MFSLKTDSECGFNLIQLSDVSNGTHVSIVPECGAILHDFSVLKNGTRHHLLATYADRDEFKNRLAEKGFMGCKLSPFAGRLNNGLYSFDGIEYTTGRFFLGHHALHGLIYDASFNIINKGAESDAATVDLLHPYKGNHAGFPFHYDCRIRYKLGKENRLSITTQIESKDHRPFPIQDGWHPYFRFGNNIGDMILELQSNSVADTDETMIPTGTWTPYTQFRSAKTIGSAHFDHCFQLNSDASSPALSLRDPASGINLNVFLRQGYPYLQLYTPEDRSSIAIEPMSAPPDAFNNRQGLLIVNPGERVEFQIEFQIEAG